MRRRLVITLVLSSTAFATSPLTYKVFTPEQQRADNSLSLSILLKNTGVKPVSFNTALCPQITVVDIYQKKTFKTSLACTQPIVNRVIPVGGHYVYTIRTGIKLPSSQYNVSVNLNDAVNGHSASLKASLSVMKASQVIEHLELPPVLLSSERPTVKVVTRNISGTVFSQDLRLCFTNFLIRDHQGRTVIETPTTQICTADIRPTTLKPDEQHTESWRIDTELAPGRYQIFHWGLVGTSTVSFEVVR